ncbi:MAG: ABC transporter substrate-binding protein [Candidatus Sumerlaeota bacterium]|nr:ABC transporter substrate-binding protein [Candidatus Sumerlaeota bacterium]
MRIIFLLFTAYWLVSASVYAAPEGAAKSDADAKTATAKDAGATSAAAKGSENPGPIETVDEAVKKILGILGSPEYKDTAKRKGFQEEIRKILIENSDVKTLSTLSLANYRSKFSDEQFEKFMDQFSRLLFATYISHFNKYTDEKIVILGAVKSAEDKAVVSTKLISSSGDTPIEYSMARHGKKWLLFDVRVEGVSLVLNYRSQFREILLNSTPDKLIQRLAEKVKKNEENL